MEGRSRRAVRTPKRFDDEAFDMPAKTREHLRQQQLALGQSPSAATLTDTPNTSTHPNKSSSTTPHTNSHPHTNNHHNHQATKYSKATPPDQTPHQAPKTLFKVKLAKTASKPRESPAPTGPPRIKLPGRPPKIPRELTQSSRPAGHSQLSSGASAQAPKQLKQTARQLHAAAALAKTSTPIKLEPSKLKVSNATPAAITKQDAAEPAATTDQLPVAIKQEPVDSLDAPPSTHRIPKETPKVREEKARLRALKEQREQLKRELKAKAPRKDRLSKSLSVSQETTQKQPRETVTKAPKPPKEAPQPKIEIQTPERDNSQLVYRPRIKRPSTPPIFQDLVPNVVLPFWDARTAAEDHEDDNVKELVHCHCGISEELGLMVQCETCLTWQHAHCLGIDRPEEAPDGYTCKACSDSRFARVSRKHGYDLDWLTKGRMKQFSSDRRALPEQQVSIHKQINQLMSAVLNIHRLIHSLRVKARILATAVDDDPELKLFKDKWSTNLQHRDARPFIPTVMHTSNTPASTISVMGEATDAADIAIETVADDPLPDIGPLEEVSAILENIESSANLASNDLCGGVDETNGIAPCEPMPSAEPTPDDCRANLKLHIMQSEEFIGIELAAIENQLRALERECNANGSALVGAGLASLESLRNDLLVMKTYMGLKRRKRQS